MSNCPVCLSDLHTSVTPVTFLRCGHPIHSNCLQSTESELGDFMISRCPLCKKCVNMEILKYISRRIQIASETMPIPAELQKNVSIYCFECDKQSHNQPFHFYGIICPHCETGNTSIV